MPNSISLPFTNLNYFSHNSFSKNEHKINPRKSNWLAKTQKSTTIININRIKNTKGGFKKLKYLSDVNDELAEFRVDSGLFLELRGDGFAESLQSQGTKLDQGKDHGDLYQVNEVAGRS